MKPTPEDLLLHRFLDGELAPAQAAALQARLIAEPALRQRLDHERALRAGFAAERATSSTVGNTVGNAAGNAAAGFTAAVVAAARRLPSRQEIQAEEVTSSTLHFCRRLLLAAAILTVVGLVFDMGLFRGLFDPHASGALQAAPDEVQQEMDRLDALVIGASGPSGK